MVGGHEPGRWFDGAIFISAFSMYRYDASYAVEVHGRIPAASPSACQSIG